MANIGLAFHASEPILQYEQNESVCRIKTHLEHSHAMSAGIADMSSERSSLSVSCTATNAALRNSVLK